MTGTGQQVSNIGDIFRKGVERTQVKANFPTSLFWCFCVATLSGCGLGTVKMYEGSEKPAVERAVVSSMAVYQKRGLRVGVVAINGKVVDPTRTTEFVVLPGRYTMILKIEKDL